MDLIHTLLYISTTLFVQWHFVVFVLACRVTYTSHFHQSLPSSPTSPTLPSNTNTISYCNIINGSETCQTFHPPLWLSQSSSVASFCFWQSCWYTFKSSTSHKNKQVKLFLLVKVYTVAEVSFSCNISVYLAIVKFKIGIANILPIPIQS